MPAFEDEKPERQVTVLNVDDSHANRYAVNLILQKAGYRVLEADTGEAALEIAKADVPDVVVLDVDLPGIDGFEVCRRLRADARTHGCAVVHLTAARMSTRDKVTGLDSGADAFLREPVGQAEILATVESLLRLSRAERAANEAATVRDNLLAIVAHDLKSPLNAAALSAQVLVTRAPAGEAGETLRRHAEVVLRSADRMNRLVQDLLDLAKIRSGAAPLLLEPIAAVAILREALDAQAGAAAHARVELAVAGDAAEGVSVSADRARTLQLLAKLIDNALRFTPAEGRIELGFVATDHEVRFSVSDTGPGIPAAQLPYLFERYNDHADMGIGVGLPTARAIVEQHGGRIWVDTKKGGTTFFFTLPSEAAP